MDIDEGAHFARSVGGEIFAEGVEFRVHGFLRGVKTSDFSTDLIRLDQIVVYVEGSGRDQVCTPDSDAS
jgi:hypothetical protein